MTTTFAWPFISCVMSTDLPAGTTAFTGRPLSHTLNVTPCVFALDVAKYLSPGPKLSACAGAFVEFACASVVLDGIGVRPAELRVPRLHALSETANAKTLAERRMTVPCMPASFHGGAGVKRRGNHGPGRIRTYAQPVMSRPLYR